MHYFSKLVLAQFGGRGGVISLPGFLLMVALNEYSDLNPSGKRGERALGKEEWMKMQRNTERNIFKHLEKQFSKAMDKN